MLPYRFLCPWPLASPRVFCSRVPTRSMQDPRIDQLVRIEIETAALLGVNAAPAVLLNSMYMMGLTGPEQMRDFQLFVGMGMTPQPQHEFYGKTGWTSMKDNGSGSSIFAG